jgi:hypothetical protein
MESFYTPLQSGRRRVIFNSPDRDYVGIPNEIRTFLDGICKRVQQRIPSSTISPITNLTWRVVKGQTVLLEIIAEKAPYRFEFWYLDGSGNRHSGSVDHKSKLLPLVLEVYK